MSVRKQYTDEFKRAAVARLKKEKVQDVCKELKISNSMIYHWRDIFNGGKKTKVNVSKLELKSGANVKDTIIYLNHARSAINEDLRTGRVKKLSQSNLLTLLALNTLTGGK